MVQEPPRRTSFSGPTLIRLLARLTDADIPEARQSLPDRLSLWLGWTDAIALSSVLNGTAPAVPAGAQVSDSAEETECSRVRAELISAVTDNSALKVRQRVPLRATATGAPKAPAIVEYSTYRRCYATLQQSMETRIASLRTRLRATLASRSPEMARLAALDAAMERALSEREYGALAGVPTLLEGHFKRLREAAGTTLDDDPAALHSQGAASDAWLDEFRKDMQSILLAELDIRLQPVEGLLAAIRACQHRTL